MSSEFGRTLRVGVFGQSHGAAIGVTVDGLPAGERIDLAELQAFLDRRKPGKSPLSTARKENDMPQFLSGLRDGATCGSPLCAVIYNSDQHSSDYTELADKPRPSHADYTAWVKWGGQADMRGGGHFSGRLTAPLCFAGAIAKQYLRQYGIEVGAHIRSIGSVEDNPFDPVTVSASTLLAVQEKFFPVLDDAAGEQMQQLIADSRDRQDSVGGVIECASVGLPAGIGDPMFDCIESRIASLVFGIPAVKGIEFGLGFGFAAQTGSQANDPFCIKDGQIKTVTNHNGGILGGITNGMPVLFRTVIKPTPSISQKQQTVNFRTGQPVELTITGRHDPCIVRRAVPCIESAAALALMDFLVALHPNNGRDCR